MERLTEIQSAGYDLKELNSEWRNKYCEKKKNIEIKIVKICIIY